MDYSALSEIGLTEGEIRTYIALLGLGKTSVGPLIEQSKVSPSKIYHILERLVEKGLATASIEGKVKRFLPAEPKYLLKMVEERENKIKETEKKLQELIPHLEKKKGLIKEEERVEIYRGINGIKAFFELGLREMKKGETMYTLGVSKEISRLFNNYFKDFHRRRAEKGIFCRSIYNFDSWQYKKREKRKLIEYRVFPEGQNSPTFLYIFKDFVGTIIVTDEEQICTAIKNREIVKTHMDYFNLMWKKARVVTL
ncbi:MAG: helix-turn-helix domain-containing protein [archaeon]